MRTSRLIALWAAVIPGFLGCSDGGADLNAPPLSNYDVATVEIVASPVMPLGEEGQLQVVLKDAKGNVIVGPAIRYSSEDSTIVSVSQSGRVRAVAEGETRVGAEAAGRWGWWRIWVQPRQPTVASLEVTPSPALTAVGSTVQLSVEARDASGNVISNPELSWTSGSTGVATVSSAGVVTGVSAGTATITATSGSASGTADVVVESAEPPPPPPSSAPANVTDLAVTGSTTTELTVRFTQVDDGAGQPARYQVRYGPTPSTNWGAMTPVSTGTCAGQVNGTAISQPLSCTVGGLTAGTQYDVQLIPYRGSMADGTAVFGNLSNRASGTTAAAPSPTIATVTVSPTSASVAVGGTTALSATARDASGNVISGVTFQWSSSSTSVATVTQSGAVTGVAAGSATITATAGSRSGQSSVTVTAPTAPTIATVTVSPTSASVNVGGTTSLSATARDGSGNVISGVSFQWSSSSTSVATVNQSGVVTGVAGGSATVTATAGGRSGQASVSVTTSSPPPSGGAFRANEPSGFRTISNHPWNALDGVNGAVRPNGWGYMNWNQGGHATIVNDASEPFSAGSAVEVFFPQGLRSGYSPATLSYDGIRTSEVYYTFTIWHQPDWVEQNPGSKLVHMMFDNGNNLHLDRYNPSPTWGGTYDVVAGQWAVAPTGWTLPRDFNNVNRAAARAKYGEWQTIELHVRMGTGTGMIRMWVDGVLTADHRNLSMGTNTITILQHGNTYGGGTYNVPQDQRLRIGHSYISVP